MAQTQRFRAGGRSGREKLRTSVGESRAEGKRVMARMRASRDVIGWLGFAALALAAAPAPALTGALGDQDASVRAESAEALAMVAGLPAAAELKALLRDENWSVRVSALSALGQVKDKADLETIIGMLGSDENDFVRAN